MKIITQKLRRDDLFRKIQKYSMEDNLDNDHERKMNLMKIKTFLLKFF